MPKKKSTAKKRPRATPGIENLGKYYHEGTNYDLSDLGRLPHIIAQGEKILIPRSAWQEARYTSEDFAGFLRRATTNELKQELRYQEFTRARVKLTIYKLQKQDLKSIDDAITRLRKAIKARSKTSGIVGTIKGWFG